jgi:hypothetical protein
MTAEGLALLLGCLGELETGNDDAAVGRHGEVSRYQVMPRVWREYGGKLDPRDPRVSVKVAGCVLAERIAVYQAVAGREPTDREVYGMWNAPGALARARGRVEGLSKRVRERCERFGALVERRRAEGAASAKATARPAFAEAAAAASAKATARQAGARYFCVTPEGGRWELRVIGFEEEAGFWKCVRDDGVKVWVHRDDLKLATSSNQERRGE